MILTWTHPNKREDISKGILDSNTGTGGGAGKQHHFTIPGIAELT